MGDELSLKFGIDSVDAVKGVDDVNAALADTAAAAEKAKESGEKVGPAIADPLKEEVVPAVSAVEEATNRLNTALEKLSTASSSPRALIRGATEAQLALIAFEEEAKKAGFSQEELQRKTDAAGAAILTANTKAATISKTLGEMRAAGQSAANQMDSLRGSAGSLEGMFSKMEKTGGANTKAIGELGLAVGVGMIAFAGAEAAGKKLAATIDFMAEKEAKLQDTIQKGINNHLRYAAAQRALAAGFIENSNSVEGLLKNYDNYLLKQGRGTEAAKAEALAVVGVTTAQLDYNKALAEADAAASALEGIFKRNADAQAKLATTTSALTDAQAKYDEVVKSGTNDGATIATAYWKMVDAQKAVAAAQNDALKSQFESNEAVKQSIPAIEKAVENARSLGQAVPESYRKVLDAAETLKAKNQLLADSFKRLMDVAKDIPAPMRAAIAEEERLAAAAKKVADSHGSLVPEIDKILGSLAQETSAAKGASNEMELLAKADTKATQALAEYGRAHGFTTKQILEMVKAQGDEVGYQTAVTDLYAKGLTGLSGYTAALNAAGAASKSFAQSQKELAEQAREANAAFDEQEAALTKRNHAMDAANDKNQASANSLATMTTNLSLLPGVFFTVTAATEAQNAALEDLLKNQNAYGDSIKNTLDVAKGWKDYLAGIADAYKTGAINLLQYKNALVDFQTQLQLTFSGATGEARKAIEAMTQAIQTMIDTAGGGPQQPFDMTATGLLNRTFNQP